MYHVSILESCINFVSCINFRILYQFCIMYTNFLYHVQISHSCFLHSLFFVSQKLDSSLRIVYSLSLLCLHSCLCQQTLCTFTINRTNTWNRQINWQTHFPRFKGCKLSRKNRWEFFQLLLKNKANHKCFIVLKCRRTGIQRASFRAVKSKPMALWHFKVNPVLKIE